MDTKKLRQKILDLAIHGKLVPQDPNDEPASVLLERIRAEKEQLIKEGKIKAPKKSKSAGDTSHYPKDVPFAVPEGWVWTEIAEISSSINYGVSESAKVTGKYRLLRITDIQDGKVSWESVPFTDYPEDKAKAFELSDGDILFARTGATVGKSYLVESAPNNAIFASYLIRVQYSHSVIPQYIKFFFESGYYWEQISSNSVGVGQPNVNGTSLGKLRIPLPPAAEQKRISEEAHRWMGVIDSLEFEAQHLSEDIGASKSRILNLAIHGKLVPQDPSDEPAIGLLKRINPNFKASDNLHYEGVLPNGWTMARIESFCTTINGLWKGDKEPLINVGVIRNANFTKDFLLDYSKIEHINVEERSFVKRNLEDGDIIVEKSGGSDNFPVGRSILYRGESGKYSFSNFTMSLRIKDKSQIIPEYLYYALQNMYRRGDMRQMQTQTTGLRNLLTDVFMSAQIPIPPSSEQRRIVEAIENHFQTLDRIRDLLQN